MTKKMTIEDQYGEKLLKTAIRGLDMIDEYFDTPIGSGEEQYERRLDRAKIGCVPASKWVAYLSALNNREALELQRAKQLGDDSQSTAA